MVFERGISKHIPLLMHMCRLKKNNTCPLSRYSTWSVCRCLSSLRRKGSKLESWCNCIKNISNRSQLRLLVFRLVFFLRSCKFPFPSLFSCWSVVLALISNEGAEHSFVWQGENNFIFITSLTSPPPQPCDGFT